LTRFARSFATRAEALAAGTLAIAALALPAGCSSAREGTSPPAREAVSAAVKPAPAPPVLPAVAAQVEAVSMVGEAALMPSSRPLIEEKVEAPPPRRAGDVLATFYGALRELSSGARKKHVRVLWLGDSHGAADFWSGNLRTDLQKRFGNGGPGFVHLGYRDYRHDGLKTSIGGKWKMRPGNPATRNVTGDGVFGLGGILFVASADSPRGTVTITEATAPAKMTWDLCYRMSGPGDELRVSLTGKPDMLLKVTDAEPAGIVRHVVLTSETPGATFGVAVMGGAPELCGLVAEGDPQAQAGVVLDTLGINGARFSTPLAWNEASWASELARRDPDLVVLEYGTNELSDWPLKDPAGQAGRGLRGARADRPGRHRGSGADRARRGPGGGAGERVRVLGHVRDHGGQGRDPGVAERDAAQGREGRDSPGVARVPGARDEARGGFDAGVYALIGAQFGRIGGRGVREGSIGR
jgi:hypothetical protein